MNERRQRYVLIAVRRSPSRQYVVPARCRRWTRRLARVPSLGRASARARLRTMGPRQPRGKAADSGGSPPRRLKRPTKKRAHSTDESDDGDAKPAASRGARPARRLIDDSEDDPTFEDRPNKKPRRKSVFELSSSDESADDVHVDRRSSKPRQSATIDRNLESGRKAVSAGRTSSSGRTADVATNVIPVDSSSSETGDEGGTKKRQRRKLLPKQSTKSPAPKDAKDRASRKRAKPSHDMLDVPDEVLDFSSDADGGTMAKRLLPRPPVAAKKESSRTAAELAASGSGSTQGSKKSMNISSFLVPLSQGAARIASSQGSQVDCPALPPETELWVDKHRPLSTASLAVNKKKVEDVESWLQEATSGIGKSGRKPRILFLTGPSGSGKTATVRALCNQLGVSLAEWVNPENEWQLFAGLVDDARSAEAESLASRFAEFVRQAAKYELAPLFFGTDAAEAAPRTVQGAGGTGAKKVIIIEDFPNIAASKKLRDAFYGALRDYASSPRSRFPIILIASDVGSGWDDSDRDPVITPRTVLPPQLRMQLPRDCVTEIHFNPVAHTLLVKLLKSLAESEKMRIKRTIQDVEYDALANRAGGDLRCAINALQFMTLLDSGVPRHAMVKGTARRKQEDRIKEAESIVSGKVGAGREATLPLFHALGKILYNKRKTDDANATGTPPQAPRMAEMSFVPEDVIDSSGLPASGLILYLSQNYPSFFEGPEEFSSAADYLSDADGFLRMEWAHADVAGVYGSIVATRGLMWSHEVPVPPAPPELVGVNRQRTLHKPEFWQKTRDLKDRTELLATLARTNAPVTAAGRSFDVVARPGREMELALEVLPYCCILARGQSQAHRPQHKSFRPDLRSE
ncbi:Rad17 cell cycle checkpoint protein-domain-containing protein [Hyaloraphidium curvatum]|nr:Rad17 cell cycle checkpoint protein-domain-containing protein [Hyaloraphidium curvatum]